MRRALRRVTVPRKPTRLATPLAGTHVRARRWHASARSTTAVHPPILPPHINSRQSSKRVARFPGDRRRAPGPHLAGPARGAAREPRLLPLPDPDHRELRAALPGDRPDRGRIPHVAGTGPSASATRKPPMRTSTGSGTRCSANSDRQGHASMSATWCQCTTRRGASCLNISEAEDVAAPWPIAVGLPIGLVGLATLAIVALRRPHAPRNVAGSAPRR